MKKMTHTTRAKLADVTRARYTAAKGKDKRRILDEFIAATGYQEKAAIPVLHPARSARRPAGEHHATTNPFGVP